MLTAFFIFVKKNDMSEFTKHQAERVAGLHLLYQAITQKNKAFETIKSNEELISRIVPGDIVIFVHELVNSGADMEVMKSGINKLLNVTYKAISNYAYHAPQKDSYLYVCQQNNLQMVKRIEQLRPVLIALNKDLENKQLRSEFIPMWKDLEMFMQYYVIKENIIFPLIEKLIPKFKCISVMWSFHDDNRRNIKEIISHLEADAPIDLKRMNRLAGDIFFNIYAIKFREERMLFPFMEDNIAPEKIEGLWNESVDMGFPYFQPEKKDKMMTDKLDVKDNDLLDLKTGLLTLDQLILIFNHIPVDLTYVDENNEVRFYSTPPHRIFPRTNAVIGRDVKNCHPHESVHVVQKIVQSFRDGSRDHADFWINMRGKKILIQYFAVRDENGKYRGVLEASQEISGIQALQGEQRILDWE
jgi:hypothetical protein